MSHLAALEAEVQDAVARAVGSVPPELSFRLFRQFADTGYRYGYEAPYFERRGRLAAAGAAALFEQRRSGAVGDGIASALADELWRVCDECTWALPAHERHVRDGEAIRRCIDLYAAETAHTVAEILALAGGRLPGQVADRARAEVLDRVLIPFADDPRPLDWESFENNWLAVCSGAVGMSALALLADGSDPERLTRIIDRTLVSMRRYLSFLGEDGGCSEGVGYWTYGFGYYVYFAEALRESGGPDLLADPKVRKIAAFPARAGYGNGAYPNFSDGHETTVLPSGLVSRLAQRLGTPVPQLASVPSFASDYCHSWAHLTRNIFWTDPAVLDVPAPDGTAFLPDLAWVVDRSGDLVFAAKGGHNDEQHNHLDIGHFILHAHGETLLVDLGAGEYTAQYFGEGRYLDVHPAAEGHSIPVVDGRTQLPGREWSASVIEFFSDDEGTEFCLDMSGAYDVPGLTRFVRDFTWRRTGVLILTDTFETTRAFPVDELFVSFLEPRIEADRVVWEGQSAVAALNWQGGEAAIDAEIILTTDHSGAPQTVHRLRLRSPVKPGTTSLEFVFSISAR